jgi:hypothetical protein
MPNSLTDHCIMFVSLLSGRGGLASSGLGGLALFLTFC